ncbi:MAG: radical domain iron-sulfur cluster-binding oxidoreductase with cobalamin-binding-like domain, partial [Deltaproteobacteria bacterium]|nr:radical domain iron-sulfur cluster-binding oxidoreductase with cobalamin-binding-like domain [Deltaproteobacteria bacterium]
MNVLLISANMETMNMPPLPLGLACVAAATVRAGHDVALINLMFEEDANRAIRSSLENFCPDVIGVSVRNVDDQNMERPRFFLDSVREVVANCRSMCRAPVILGGA